jgi:uncharacterized protein
MQRFRAEQFVPRPIDEVFRFFSDAHNLPRITPPAMRFTIVAMSTPTIGEGTLIDYKLRIRGVPVRWRSRIEQWIPNERFVDTQVRGPYASWHHLHRFEERDGGTWITDDVHFALPLGLLGRVVAGRWVRRDVERIFAHRRAVIARLMG